MLAIYIVGAGGHGRELHSYIEHLRRARWRGELRGYLDDAVAPGQHGRLHVVGPIDRLKGIAGWYITALGSNAVRRDVVERIISRYRDALKPWTLLHPQAYIGEDVEIGNGTCIAPGTIITTTVRIGNHCIVNVNASISHDCVIGDFVNINPGAIVCGAVRIGEGAYIGAGAVLKEGISIGAWSTIGAGAVVIRDVPPSVTSIGVPARVVDQH
jgi:sugar O-acyltransferase (sialic acid O-acetyltransferase NeuD family)